MGGRRRILALLAPAAIVAAGVAAMNAVEPWTRLGLLVAIVAAGAVGAFFARGRTRHRADEGRSRDERLLDSIVENIPIMMFVKDAATLRFVRVNRSTEELVGLSREQMIGKRDADLFPPEQAEKFERGDREALSSGALVDIREEEIETTRGRRLLHTKKIPILDERGEPAYVLGISQDVTETRRAREERDRLLAREQAARKAAERAWASSDASARRMRELLAITEIALTKIELDDLLARVTERIRDVFRVDTVAVVLLTPGRQELRVEAALGIPGAVGLRFPPGTGLAASTLAVRRAVIVDDLSRMELANPLLREIGVRSVVAVPLRLEERAIGVLHAGTLSPRRFSEDEATLLQLVGDRVAIAIDRSRAYEQEHSSRQEAEMTVRARGELLAVVSHDLRNPLNAITLSARTLRSRLIPQGDTAGGLKNVDVIARQAERMTRLIRDLLDATRIEAQGLAIEPARNDAGAIVADAVNALRPLADEKALRVELATGEVPPVLCDRERILQVLGNLLGNSIKFTPRGGTIQVMLRDEAPFALFGVADTGPGIAEDVAARIFERYWRADPNSRESNGLGLYIAKGIVERHGGQIWVEGREGQGARFWFTIPEAGPLEATVLEPAAPA